ncbi:hypothetical protein BDD12DRAFT_760981 [Trichophaea hybrida]|nr:hypothetical protein BDD12DRAFT_760981 [Trichophaea hybrida]
MLHFKENGSPSTIVKTILDVPANELHIALVEATRTAEIQELSIIIDGIDITEPEEVVFVQIIYSLVKKMMDAVSKFKALLTSSQIPKLKEIFGELQCIEHDKERKDCLDFLPHDDTRYGKVLHQHEGSLEWLWKHAQYQLWSASKCSSLLFVEWKPGSGKSTLTKYFKENLADKEPNACSSTVAHYFYTYRGIELESTHENMLRSILYQILEQDESIFFYLQRTFREARGVQEVHRGNISKWPYKSLKDVLSSFANLPSTKPIYLILDAIDESEEGDRRDIIELLCNLCSEENRCHIKVFLASRPVAELNGHIRKHYHLIKLQDENKDEISQFADDFLSKDLGLTGSDRGEARDYIVDNARGVFVWVALVKKELRIYIETGYRKGEVLEYLASLPQELLGFYKLMLRRLERGTPRDIQDGQKIFRWVLFGFRPLTVVELCHALAVPDDCSLMVSYEEFTRREFRGMEMRILNCGGNFLEIKSDGTVQLMHPTVREFLLQTFQDATNSNLATTETNAHTAMITTSLQYLMLCFSICPTMRNRFSTIETWASEDFQAYVRYLNEWPLLNYTLSSLNYHHHYCDLNECVSQLISTLIDQLTPNQASCF